MSRSDHLALELGRRALATPYSVVRQLLAMGAPVSFVGSLASAGMLAAGLVSIGKAGLFDFDGTEARLLVGVVEERELVDVVAISSTRRDEWHLLTGATWCLGHEHFAFARAGLVRTLRLHATPMGWLTAGGAGICVLDWDAVALGWLRGLGPELTITCDDAGAAARLSEVLARGDLPRVTGDAERMAA